MKKLNIYLTDNIYENLREHAHKSRISMSEMVRNALKTLLRDEESKKLDYQKDPFDELIGKASFGPNDISINHDKYLYGWDKD